RDPDGGDLPTARAVAALGERLGLDETRSLLAHALRSRHLETARECLLSLGHRRVAEAIPALARVLALDRGDLAVAAAEPRPPAGSRRRRHRSWPRSATPRRRRVWPPWPPWGGSAPPPPSCPCTRSRRRAGTRRSGARRGRRSPPSTRAVRALPPASCR